MIRGDRTVRTREDADALVLGLALLSTGGGGLPFRGRSYLYQLLDEGHEVSWMPPEHLPAQAPTCSVFGMGSIAPHPRMDEEEMGRFGVHGEVIPRPGVRAIRELGEHLGAPLAAVVPFELGAFNTIVAIDAGTRLGLPVVDGDYIGRALPEMSQALPAAAGLPVWPLAICDHWGTVLVMKDCPSASVAERVGKMISIVTKTPDMLATCAHAAFPMPVERAMPFMVRGSLTRALAAGRAVLDARDSGRDPVGAARSMLDGFLLFMGTVRDMEWEDREGYMIGFTHLEGEGPFAGETGRVWFRNENHIFWRDGQVRATSPDLIAVVTYPEAEPRVNTELTLGERVALLGFRCADQYRTGAPLAMTEPRHYGFDISYAPVEGTGVDAP